MRLKIQHSTRYSFEEPVRFGLQQLRKTPKSSDQQKVLAWQTKIRGGTSELTFTDHHRNITELISFDHTSHELELVCEGEVEVKDTHGVVGPHRGFVPLWLFEKTTDRTEARSGVRDLVSGFDPENTLDALHKLSERIQSTVKYEVGASRPDWTAEDAIEAGKGVCQDHTHILLACARRVGLPARYVSGYLMLNDRISQEAMHAWAEVHVPDLGWVGFDVSNGISPDTRYVRVATGLDYSDAAPVSGTRIGGAGEQLEVQIDVAQQ